VLQVGKSRDQSALSSGAERLCVVSALRSEAVSSES
jgi:hypothetical protein